MTLKSHLRKFLAFFVLFGFLGLSLSHSCLAMEEDLNEFPIENKIAILQTISKTVRNQDMQGRFERDLYMSFFKLRLVSQSWKTAAEDVLITDKLFCLLLQPNEFYLRFICSPKGLKQIRGNELGIFHEEGEGQFGEDRLYCKIAGRTETAIFTKDSIFKPKICDIILNSKAYNKILRVLRDAENEYENLSEEEQEGLCGLSTTIFHSPATFHSIGIEDLAYKALLEYIVKCGYTYCHNYENPLLENLAPLCSVLYLSKWNLSNGKDIGKALSKWDFSNVVHIRCCATGEPHLSSEDIGETGFLSLFTSLKNFSKLEIFDFTGSLDSHITEKCAEALGQSLAYLPNLQLLSLERGKMGPKGTCAFLKGLSEINSKLTKLNLYGNGMGDEGCAVLQTKLDVLKHLEILEIGNNVFKDTPGGESCKIGEESMKALQKKVDDYNLQRKIDFDDYNLHHNHKPDHILTFLKLQHKGGWFHYKNLSYVGKDNALK